MCRLLSFYALLFPSSHSSKDLLEIRSFLPMRTVLKASAAQRLYIERLLTPSISAAYATE